MLNTNPAGSKNGLSSPPVMDAENKVEKGKVTHSGCHRAGTCPGWAGTLACLATKSWLSAIYVCVPGPAGGQELDTPGHSLPTCKIRG